MVLFPPPSPDNDWDSEEEDGIADQQPLDVSCVPVNSFQVVISSLPGRRCSGVRRSLVADIETLKKNGVQDVFVLCTEAELRRCHVPTLLVDYLEQGMISHHHPLEDDHLSLPCCLPLLQELHSCLNAGRKTAIHCTDGFGQSCLAVVLLAMFLDSDLPPMVAMEIVQGARGPAAIQTIKQYNFAMDFRKNLAEYDISSSAISPALHSATRATLVS
jgi:hypothetical protein